MSAPTTTYKMELDKRDTALILAALGDKALDAFADAEAAKDRNAWKSAEDSEAYASVLQDIRSRIIDTSTAHYRGETK